MNTDWEGHVSYPFVDVHRYKENLGEIGLQRLDSAIEQLRDRRLDVALWDLDEGLGYLLRSACLSKGEDPDQMHSQTGLRFNNWDLPDCLHYLARRGKISERDIYDAYEIHRWYEARHHEANPDRSKVRRAISRVRTLAMLPR